MSHTPKDKTIPTRSDPPRAASMVAVLIGLGAALVLLLYLLPRPIAMLLLDEGGAMERVSLWVYALDILLLALHVRRRPRLVTWAILSLILLAVCEMNPGNVLSTLIDAPPEVSGGPVGVRPLGVLVVGALVLGVLYALVRSASNSFRSLLRPGSPDVRLAALGAFFVPLTFFIDRIQSTRFNWNRGYRMEKGIFFASDVIEETLEFLMPFAFLCAILLWSRLGRGTRREAS